MNSALCCFLTAKLESYTQDRINANSTPELQNSSPQQAAAAAEVTKFQTFTGTTELQK